MSFCRHRKLFFGTRAADSAWVFYFLQKVRNMGEKEKLTLHEISDQEWQVLQHLRQLQYGELLVAVKDGRPIRVEEIRKSIQIK